MQECFQNKFVFRSSHQVAFFNIAVLHLWRNSLKNTCDEVRFFVNLHVTLSNFEPCHISVEKLYFITALMLNNNFCRTPQGQPNTALHFLVMQKNGLIRTYSSTYNKIRTRIIPNTDTFHALRALVFHLVLSKIIFQTLSKTSLNCIIVNKVFVIACKSEGSLVLISYEI